MNSANKLSVGVKINEDREPFERIIANQGHP